MNYLVCIMLFKFKLGVIPVCATIIVFPELYVSNVWDHHQNHTI